MKHEKNFDIANEEERPVALGLPILLSLAIWSVLIVGAVLLIG